jgi:hypothetical protein
LEDFKRFLEVVKENDFVEGHEVLEDRWNEYKKIEELKEESYILKGLINGSTALALKVKGKDEGAKRVWSTFLKYLPLIDSINSKHTNFYNEAKKLLFEKEKAIMK